MGGFSRQEKGRLFQNLKRVESHTEGLGGKLPGAEVPGDLCDMRLEFQAEDHSRCPGSREQGTGASGVGEAREKATVELDERSWWVLAA